MEALRTRLREAAAVNAALLAEAAAAGVLDGASAHDLLGLVADGEALGRVADAFRILTAGEVADRCRRATGPITLADRVGCTSPRDLLERVARISAQTARARLKLGTQTHAGITLTGDRLPAEYDVVRRGLVSGRLGVDSAVVITRMLDTAKTGAPTDTYSRFRPAEQELVCAAIGAAPTPDSAALPPVPPAITAEQATVWVEVLNPDGTEQSARTFDARRFTLHRPRDGMVPVTGLLTAEVAGTLQAVFASLTNAHQSLRFLTDEDRAAMETAEAPAIRGRSHSVSMTPWRRCSVSPAGPSSCPPWAERHRPWSSPSSTSTSPPVVGPGMWTGWTCRCRRGR